MKRYGVLLLLFGTLAMAAGLFTLNDPRPRPQVTTRYGVLGYTTAKEDVMVSRGAVVIGLALMAGGALYIRRLRRDEKAEAQFKRENQRVE